VISHPAAHFSKAVENERAGESRELQRSGSAALLKHTRWCLLKRPENRTEPQSIPLRKLVKRNLRTVRAYLLKEDLQTWTSLVCKSREWPPRGTSSTLRP
jgi:transposase